MSNLADNTNERRALHDSPLNPNCASEAMKILLINKDCQIAGTETFMAALASTLREAGHQCEFFFFERGPMEEHLPHGCPAHFGDLADCMKLIAARRFDIAHINSGDWGYGLSAVRNAGVRLVVTSHGWVVPNWNSSNCDALVSCSEWQAKEQKNFTDLPVHVAMNGIDIDKFVPATNASATAQPVVAWVGRGAALRQKRIDKLADIAPKLHAAGVRLWIADPHGAKKVAEVAPEAARTLEPLAEFWDVVPIDRMPEFYRQVAASGGCIISTASFEGLPLTLAEAQGCGCPVIGADVRGVNEVVRPEHGGVLYSFETKPEQLAKLVLETLGDKEGMRQRGEISAQHVRQRFSLQRMAADYLRVYEEAMSRPLRDSQTISARSIGQLLEPVLHWQRYVEQRWMAGSLQYDASEKLAAEGEWNLARVAAQCALTTCPTLYARPARLAHLLKILRHPKARLSNRAALK